MSIPSETEKQAWVDKLSQKLQECKQNNRLDILIDYRDISKAFPALKRPSPFSMIRYC